MSLKIFSLFTLFIIAATHVYAKDVANSAGTVHTVKITQGWCGNLLVSTKVGNLVNGKCQYKKETTPRGYDDCTYYLNGGLLEMNLGKGYQCGATHIYSNLKGKDFFDEFEFILDINGHYVGSNPSNSEISLVLAKNRMNYALR